MAIFVNDRSWNLKKAKEYYDQEQWHLKRSQEALRRGDISASKDHATKAKSYRHQADEYKRDASKSTK